VDIKLKELNTFSRELIIDLAWSEIEADFENAIKTFSKKIKLPGFRPGKVPRKVLMGQFQPSIEADFIDKSVNKYYSKALEEDSSSHPLKQTLLTNQSINIIPKLLKKKKLSL